MKRYVSLDDKAVIYKKGKASAFLDDMQAIEEVLDDEVFMEHEAGSMVLFLGFVVFLFAVLSGVFAGGYLYAITLKAAPGVNRAWLMDEVELIALQMMIWVILVQIGAILIHARIGRLIAK